MIYTDDHAPPHAHVIFGPGKGEDSCKVEIESLMVSKVSRRLREKDISQVVDFVEENSDFLLQQWKEIFNG